MAVEVVDGATVRIGPPDMAVSVGARCGRSASWSQPRPSSTRNSTWSASAALAREPGRPGGRLAEQRGHDVADAGPAVVRQQRCVGAGRVEIRAAVTFSTLRDLSQRDPFRTDRQGSASPSGSARAVSLALGVADVAIP